MCGRGPYQIAYRVNDLIYMVRKNYITVTINLNRLKPYMARGISNVEPYINMVTISASKSVD